MDEFVMIRNASHRSEDVETDTESELDSSVEVESDKREQSSKALSLRGKVMGWRTSSYKSLVKRPDEDLVESKENERSQFSKTLRKHQSFSRLTNAVRSSARFTAHQEKLRKSLKFRKPTPNSNAPVPKTAEVNFAPDITKGVSSDNPLFIQKARSFGSLME